MNIIAICSCQAWNKGKLLGQRAPLRLRLSQTCLQLYRKSHPLSVSRWPDLSHLMH